MLIPIQALRALAALLIVFYHALPHYAYMHGNNAVLEAFQHFGYAGVDIFFVISGFVISLTTSDKPRALASAAIFLRNRAARIYLGYWPFLLFICLLYAAYDPVFLQNTRALVKSVFLYSPNTRHLLNVAWSLNYEIYFYLLFTLLFCVPQGKLPAVVTALFVLVVLRSLLIPAAPHSYFEFCTSPYLLEFLGGSLLYHFRSFLLDKRYLVPMVSGIILGGYAGYHFDCDKGLARVMTFGVAAFCLNWLFLAVDAQRIFRIGPRWSALGDASYTLYLSHTVILMLFSYSGLREWLAHQHLLLVDAGFIILLLVIITSSLLFYRFVEAPLYHRVRALHHTV